MAIFPTSSDWMCQHCISSHESVRFSATIPMIWPMIWMDCVDPVERSGQVGVCAELLIGSSGWKTSLWLVSLLT